MMSPIMPRLAVIENRAEVLASFSFTVDIADIEFGNHDQFASRSSVR